MNPPLSEAPLLHQETPRDCGKRISPRPSYEGRGLIRLSKSQEDPGGPTRAQEKAGSSIRFTLPVALRGSGSELRIQRVGSL